MKDEEAIKKAEEAGKKLVQTTTQSADVDLTRDDVGVGVPIFIFPEFGYSKQMMIPFFGELERIASCKFIDLPSIDQFRNLPRAGGMPDYPIDKLVEAFEDERVRTKADKIAIVACGFNSCIAMRYATKYPKHVVGIIFVSPHSSSDKDMDALNRILAKARGEGDTELLHLGMSMQWNSQRGLDGHKIYHQDNSVPYLEGEDEAIDRKEFTTRFFDQKDSVLAQLHPVHTHAAGQCLVPEYNVAKEEPIMGSVLVINGQRSINASDADCEAVAARYNAEHVLFQDSADFPFVEEPEKFSQTVKAFMIKRLKAPKDPKAKK